MNQSNVIFGVLLLAFVVYITTRGELPEYIGLFSKEKTETKQTKSSGFKFPSFNLFGSKG